MDSLDPAGAEQGTITPAHPRFLLPPCSAPAHQSEPQPGRPVSVLLPGLAGSRVQDPMLILTVLALFVLAQSIELLFPVHPPLPTSLSNLA